MATLKDFAWPTKPVDQILGPATHGAVQAINGAQACIIARGTFKRNDKLTSVRLTEPRTLSAAHVHRLRVILQTPESYWIGSPVYRRLPPRPDFLIECASGDRSLVVAVDLNNPGWEMVCEKESYWGFMFAGSELRVMAKQLFPEFALPWKSAMWARGALPKAPVTEELRHSIKKR